MKMAKWCLAASVSLGVMMSVGTAMAGDPPVGMLIQAQGAVEFSRDGAQWSPVTRNKMLFAGDMIRTGADGSAKFVSQADNTARTIAPGSTVKTEAGGPKAVSGSVSGPEAVGGDLVAGLGNRFAEAQRYTTVRRAAKDAQGEAKVETAPSVKLSASFPSLVWGAAGPGLGYTLAIDGKSQPVVAVSGDVVRAQVTGLTPGQHTYKVSAVDSSGKVVAEGKESAITWLSDADDKAIADGLAKIKQAAPGDDFAIGSYLDDKGMTVAAMDHYRQYFAAYPEDNDMRPLLIKAYNDLKLKEMKTAEAELYNKLINVR